MSATAVAEKPTINNKAAAEQNGDILLVLSDGSMTVDELLKKVHPLSVSAAWARGDIEFGQRKHTVTGCPDIKGGEEAKLIIEDGIDWTGPKTVKHKKFAEFKDDFAIPKCKVYRRYDKVRNEATGELDYKPVLIDRDEAIKLLAMSVRLTDDGLKKLQTV